MWRVRGVLLYRLALCLCVLRVPAKGKPCRSVLWHSSEYIHLLTLRPTGLSKRLSLLQSSYPACFLRVGRRHPLSMKINVLSCFACLLTPSWILSEWTASGPLRNYNSREPLISDGLILISCWRPLIAR
ncbi:hypothetical protein EDD85DRAFT_27521 [Armillaria nabsnona]|nr:hypothetical protein EDD85DRAFT_27521 [Armillaria nabsnona]